MVTQDIFMIMKAKKLFKEMKEKQSIIFISLKKKNNDHFCISASKKGNTPVRRNNAPNETIFGSEEDRNRWAVPVERNQQVLLFKFFFYSFILLTILKSKQNSHEIDVTKDEEKAAEEILQTEYNETIDDAYKEEKDIIEDIEPNEISIPISIDDVDDGKMDKIEGDTWDDIPDLEKVEEEEIKEIEV